MHRTEQLEGLAKSADQKLIRVQVVQPLIDKKRGWQLVDVLGIIKVSAEHAEDFIELDLANSEISNTGFDEENKSDNLNITEKVCIWSVKPIAE